MKIYICESRERKFLSAFEDLEDAKKSWLVTYSIMGDKFAFRSTGHKESLGLVENKDLRVLTVINNYWECIGFIREVELYEDAEHL